MDLKNITIVLPTRNESRNIARFLESIPENMNLIVVDDSEDDTKEQVRTIRSAEFTRVVGLSGSVTEARQLGSYLANTQWLLFTDADVVFAGNYFSEQCQVLADESSCRQL